MKTPEENAAIHQSVTEMGLNASDAEDWFIRFKRQKSSAKQRGLTSPLTFEDYLIKIKEAGITEPNQLGSFSGQYHLGRLGDVGDYEIDNCRFITSNQNHREAHANGRNDALYEKLRGETKETSERCRKLSEAHVGRTKETHQYLADRSAQQKGRTKETHAYLAEKGPKIAESKAKTFVLTAPDGTIHQGKNLSTFCRTHNLSISGIAGACGGRLNGHKGWTGHYVRGDEEV